MCGALISLAVSSLVSGDFCTLVRAGYSTRQAILAQLFTAIAAFIGTATAIAISADNRIEEPIILFTAGGFIYLAGTTILPEVLNEEERKLHESKHTEGLLRFAKFVAFCVGILFLSMVDWLNSDFHHHHSAASHTHEHSSFFQESAVGSQQLHQSHTEL
jgi:zinc transporter ZupT